MIEPLDYDAVGFISGLEVHQQLYTDAQALLPLPGRALHRDARRRSAAPHAPDPLRARRVRRHGAHGVQDEEGDHLSPEPHQRVHVRDGRHAAVPGEPGGDRRRHRALPDDEHGHHRRGAHRAEAVPRRLDPHRLPAHRDRRRERLAAVQGPQAHRHPRQRRRGLVPRGVRQGPPHRLAHRPPRHAAHRDRDRARAAHAGGGARRDPALRADRAIDAAACARASARAART